MTLPTLAESVHAVSGAILLLTLIGLVIVWLKVAEEFCVRRWGP